MIDIQVQVVQDKGGARFYRATFVRAGKVIGAVQVPDEDTVDFIEILHRTADDLSAKWVARSYNTTG